MPREEKSAVKAYNLIIKIERNNLYKHSPTIASGRKKSAKLDRKEVRPVKQPAT